MVTIDGGYFEGDNIDCRINSGNFLMSNSVLFMAYMYKIICGNISKPHLLYFFRLSTNRDYTERGNADTIYVDYDNITLFVKPGTRIFLDHGRIGLIALEVEVNTILCKIENSGLLGSRVSVSVPEVVMDIPPITDRDRSDLKFCVEQKIDFVIVSFARSAELVEHVRQILGEKGKQIKIIAKIETKEGIENLTEIIQAADGIFIGRGHMGVEMPLEKIFLGQKAIISRCNKVVAPSILS